MTALAAVCALAVVFASDFHSELYYHEEKAVYLSLKSTETRNVSRAKYYSLVVKLDTNSTEAWEFKHHV